MKVTTYLYISLLLVSACKKKEEDPPPVPGAFSLVSWQTGGQSNQDMMYDIPVNVSIHLRFSAAINRTTVTSAVTLKQGATDIPFGASYTNGDSTLIVTPSQPLQYLKKYQFKVTSSLKSTTGGILNSVREFSFLTSLDSTDKFPQISDTALVEKVQEASFSYFWDFAHPVSGLARERNNSGDVVTSGGSGFGIMALITGIHRNFITRTEGLARMQTIVGFLKNTAQKFHGAFPHWLNGVNGTVVPFSTKDNGADLVETSFLLQGLLCARQFFNGPDAAETSLRADINTIWNGVEWNWFRKNNENVLYWHWSPNYNFEVNLPIRGWNECLVTYVLAASSPTHSIPKIVYDNGWAQNGAMLNGNSYYGMPLPLGPAYGGPLFFSHYSFLGINPNHLTDAYASYQTQVRNHARINYEYCRDNPNNYYGYSSKCWGLTASDVPNGYAASSPTNDLGVIAPTAALSSFPYTPAESMEALKFYYYKLGDKLWSTYGFYDAFSLKDAWFSNTYLAIDQGPIVVMMENYRSGLLWNLFMSCPEVKSGMLALGFQSPYLN